MLPTLGAAWDLSDMAGIEELRGRALYDALMRIKPEGLAETDWALAAGLNRGFFSNLKANDSSPRSDTLRKLLRHIGRAEADLSAGIGVPEPNAFVQHFEGASLRRMRQDIPIYGTALGAERIIDGQAVEQGFLNSGEVIAYAKRPVILDGRGDAYGIYVQGSSMDPAFEDGSLILVETKRPPRIGDNVVVYLRQRGEEGDMDFQDDGATARMVMVKKLIRRNSSFVELQQHNPKLIFQIEMADVLKLHRVIPLTELLS